MVSGLTGKQLDSNDITLWVNAKVLSAKALPMLKAARPQMIQGLEQELGQAPGMNPKFIPLLKAAVNQLLNGAEEILMDGQAATISVNIGKEGINTSVVAEFEPASYLGKLMGSVKNANGRDNLIATPTTKGAGLVRAPDYGVTTR